METFMGGNLIKTETMEIYEAGQRDGITIGKAEGRAEGKTEGRNTTLLILDRRAQFPGETPEDTAQAVGCPVDDVRAIIDYKPRKWR